MQRISKTYTFYLLNIAWSTSYQFLHKTVKEIFNTRVFDYIVVHTNKISPPYELEVEWRFEIQGVP